MLTAGLTALVAVAAPQPEHLALTPGIDLVSSAASGALKVLAPGQGTAATTFFHLVLCDLGLKSMHTHRYCGQPDLYHKPGDDKHYGDTVLKKWGISPHTGMPNDPDDMRKLIDQLVSAIKSEGIEAVSDHPFIYFYDELKAAFPKAAVLLATRNATEWARKRKGGSLLCREAVTEPKPPANSSELPLLPHAFALLPCLERQAARGDRLKSSFIQVKELQADPAGLERLAGAYAAYNDHVRRTAQASTDFAEVDVIDGTSDEEAIDSIKKLLQQHLEHAGDAQSRFTSLLSTPSVAADNAGAAWQKATNDGMGPAAAAVAAEAADAAAANGATAEQAAPGEQAANCPLECSQFELPWAKTCVTHSSCSGCPECTATLGHAVSADQDWRRFKAKANTIPVSDDTVTIPDESPNFLLMLADDLGYGDLGSYGNQMAVTPNLDQLAADGVRFMHYYSPGTTCVPSRVAMMTGRLPARWNETPEYDWTAKTPTVAEVLLRGAGYRTAHFGRWNIGPDAVVQDAIAAASSKTRSGGASSATVYGFEKVDMGDVPSRKTNGCTRDENTFDVAIEQLEMWASVDPARPWYMNVWARTPRAPVPSTDCPWLLEGLGNVSVDERRLAEADLAKLRAARSQNITAQFAMRAYGAELVGLDYNVGRLLDKLSALALVESTVVAFSSDHGPGGSTDVSENDIYGPDHLMMGSVGKLRGGKGSFLEGGVRIPLILRWPGKFPAGVVDDTSLLSHIDWLPTVSVLAHVGLMPSSELDGENVFTAWTGTPRPNRTRPLCWQDYWKARPRRSAIIRDGQWKFYAQNYSSELAAARGQLDNPANTFLLFDLLADANETHPVKDHAEVAERLSLSAAECDARMATGTFEPIVDPVMITARKPLTERLDGVLKTEHLRQTLIPRTIMQTARSWGDLTEEGKDAIRVWRLLHPDYDHKFFNDSECLAYLRQNLGPRYAAAFEGLQPGAFKADLFRVAWLYHQGGIYADVDSVPLQSLDVILPAGASFVGVVERPEAAGGLYNCFIATAPHSPLLGAVLERIVDNVMNQNYFEDALILPGKVNGRPTGLFTISGPLALGNRINELLGAAHLTTLPTGKLSLASETMYLLKPAEVSAFETHLVDERNVSLIRAERHQPVDEGGGSKQRHAALKGTEAHSGLATEFRSYVRMFCERSVYSCTPFSDAPCCQWGGTEACIAQHRRLNPPADACPHQNFRYNETDAPSAVPQAQKNITWQFTMGKHLGAPLYCALMQAAGGARSCNKTTNICDTCLATPYAPAFCELNTTIAEMKPQQTHERVFCIGRSFSPNQSAAPLDADAQWTILAKRFRVDPLKHCRRMLDMSNGIFEVCLPVSNYNTSLHAMEIIKSVMTFEDDQPVAGLKWAMEPPTVTSEQHHAFNCSGPGTHVPPEVREARHHGEPSCQCALASVKAPCSASIFAHLKTL
tara:strand:- start:8460 stop:12788 length:4329 start_codon:yes stop_codon:yes gene_type:complete